MYSLNCHSFQICPKSFNVLHSVCVFVKQQFKFFINSPMRFAQHSNVSISFESLHKAKQAAILLTNEFGMCSLKSLNNTLYKCVWPINHDIIFKWQSRQGEKGRGVKGKGETHTRMEQQGRAIVKTTLHSP